MERDFTTAGTHGRLRCPFAKPTNRGEQEFGLPGKSCVQNTGESCGHSSLDPIEAELGAKGSGQSVTSSGVGARCPIRYMDQHSPEEVAEFVEKHKKELPRSHTVCVQRYQRDSQSMRKLDAKYGGLISMIRGLGEKHQAFLPDRDEASHASSKSVEGVGKWAEDVSSRTSLRQTTPVENGVEERESHFDRPLREIRVGESPSRPWGIHVPINYSSVPSPPRTSASPSDNQKDKENHPMGEKEANLEPAINPTGPRRCPFNHAAAAAGQNGKATSSKSKDQAVNTTQTTNPNSNSPCLIFNGPVFFGYSAEQTVSFLKQMPNNLQQ